MKRFPVFVAEAHNLSNQSAVLSEETRFIQRPWEISAAEIHVIPNLLCGRTANLKKLGMSLCRAFQTHYWGTIGETLGEPLGDHSNVATMDLEQALHNPDTVTVSWYCILLIPQPLVSTGHRQARCIRLYTPASLKPNGIIHSLIGQPIKACNFTPHGKQG